MSEAGDVPFPRISSLSHSRLSYLINISERCSAAYFEVPKAGCSTIKLALQRAELENPNYLPADVHDKARSPLGSPADDSDLCRVLFTRRLFLFSFVRNPFLRVLSAYLDKVVNHPDERAALYANIGISTSAEEIAGFADVLRAVRNTPVGTLDMHWCPQVELTLRRAIPLDFIGRTENLDADLRKLFRYLGVPQYYICHHCPHRTNSAEKISQYLGAEEIRLITDIYSQDFRAFNYSPHAELA